MASDDGARGSILVVDDDVDSIRLLAGILGDMGEVLFATSGEAALRMAAQQCPLLVLLDVELPGADGYRICRSLTQDPRTREAAVMMITAHSSTANEIAALDAGAVDFIAKPFNPPVVRARVRTQLRLQQQSLALSRMAATDGLTGLANRRSFDASWQAELERHARHGLALAVALIDVDHFKAYNDGYSHQQGDLCLRRVADALREAARRPGEAVARYGGEEFAVILPYTGHDEAQCFGGRVCALVRDLRLPHAYSKTAAWVTISAGLVTAVPDREAPPTALLEAADRALYAAKAGGRDRYCLGEVG